VPRFRWTIWLYTLLSVDHMAVNGDGGALPTLQAIAAQLAAVEANALCSFGSFGNTFPMSRSRFDGFGAHMRRSREAILYEIFIGTAKINGNPWNLQKI